MTLTVGSLFSGIGGIDLGLERAGMKVLWQVEKDEYARKVLKKHWPEAIWYGDVRYIKGPGHEGHWEECDECLKPVDVLCGGFPCQDVSCAGRGAGIKEGTRSGLWFEYARLIREIRPRYVVIENVPALKSRGLDRVLGDLASCGYDAEWDCFPAAAFGAPHRRDRLFLVAYPQREFVRLKPGRWSREDRTDTVFPPSYGQQGHVAGPAGLTKRESSTQANTESDTGQAWNEPSSSEYVADAYSQPQERTPEPRSQCDSGSVESGLGGTTDGLPSGLDGHPWSGDWESGVPRVASAVPSRVDRLRCLGNAVLPQISEFIGRLIVAHAARQEAR